MHGSFVEHAAATGGACVRLVDYLKAHLVAVPVTDIGDLITGGFVELRSSGRTAVGRTADPVRDGDVVAIRAERLAALRDAGRWNPPWPRELELVFEDNRMVVVAKPAGLHVHPLGDRRDRTLLGALLAHATGGAGEDALWAPWRPHVVQRLDCTVSGLLLVAKGPGAKAAFVRQQAKRQIARGYTALVEGEVRGDEGSIDLPIGREPGRGWRRAILSEEHGGRRALTHWKVRERRDGSTLVELEPETGRTHQLRVHLASLGHPIVGDRLYGSSTDCGAAVSREGRELAGTAGVAEAGARLGDVVRPIALHATLLRLRHPDDGRAIELRSDLPPRFTG